MSGNPHDPSAVIQGSAGKSGVPHEKTLIGFAESVLGEDEEALIHSREELLDKLGQEGLVDSAAVAATFSMMDRIADSTGIPLDGMLDMMTVKMRTEIGLDRFSSAANTPKPGRVKRILSRCLKPFAPMGMKVMLAFQGKSGGSNFPGPGGGPPSTA